MRGLSQWSSAAVLYLVLSLLSLATALDKDQKSESICASMCQSNTVLRAGFVEEMRFVAMRLHTKDQAPKEGQKPAENPWQKVRHTMPGCPESTPALARRTDRRCRWRAVAANTGGVLALLDRVKGGV